MLPAFSLSAAQYYAPGPDRKAEGLPGYNERIQEGSDKLCQGAALDTMPLPLSSVQSPSCPPGRGGGLTPSPPSPLAAAYLLPILACFLFAQKVCPPLIIGRDFISVSTFWKKIPRQIWKGMLFFTQNKAFRNKRFV
jgi:hypothetical protein